MSIYSYFWPPAAGRRPDFLDPFLTFILPISTSLIKKKHTASRSVGSGDATAAAVARRTGKVSTVLMAVEIPPLHEAGAGNATKIDDGSVDGTRIYNNGDDKERPDERRCKSW